MSSDAGQVRVKVHAPSGTITLDRPHKRNALTRAMLAQLAQALEDLHRQKSVRAVILAGSGPVFCAGMDLEEMRSGDTEAEQWALWAEDAVGYRDVLEQMLRLPKPIIAAVHGPALAGGAGLVLASDLVVACAGAELGFPEPRRGLSAAIVAPLLEFRLGASRAARLLLTAETASAQQAHAWGLYHELTEHDTVWAKAHSMAGEIAHSAPESIQMTKKMLNETVGEHLFTLLAAGAAASAAARTTESAAEGIAAFLEKREPKWP